MIKKFIPLAILLISLGFIYYRYKSTPPGPYPLPYTYQYKEKQYPITPLVFIGDKMGNKLNQHLSFFQKELSKRLSKPLQVSNLSRNTLSISRVNYLLDQQKEWPQVLIFHGNAQEDDKRYLATYRSKILNNFNLYEDEYWQTLFILFPKLARIFYTPYPHFKLARTSEILDKPNQSDMRISYLLYELELRRLIKMAKSRKTLLVLMTTPINLDVPPKNICQVAQTPKATEMIEEVRNLIKKSDFKNALSLANKLVEQNLGHALVYYIHGQVSLQNGLENQAKESLLKASAYDCSLSRSNHVLNNIMREVARDEEVLLYDFAQLVHESWNKNATFSDDIYPQTYFYEKAMSQLAQMIRIILKL